MKVGDKVQIKPNHRPLHGFGQVRYGDIGVIIKVDSGRSVGYVVDFPNQRTWNAGKDDLVLVEEVFIFNYLIL